MEKLGKNITLYVGQVGQVGQVSTLSLHVCEQYRTTRPTCPTCPKISSYNPIFSIKSNNLVTTNNFSNYISNYIITEEVRYVGRGVYLNITA